MRALKQGVQFLLFCLMLFIPVWGWAQSVNRQEGGRIVRWARSTTIHFVVDEVSFHGSPISDPVHLARQAASAWEIPNPNIPRFRVEAGMPGPINSHNTEDNDQHNIRFYRQGFPRTNRPVLAITLLTRNTMTDEVMDADILLDGSNPFAILGEPMVGIPGAPYDFLNVLTHEFGHTLGLVEDPLHESATMFPTSQRGEVAKRTLDPSDILSLTETYAQEPAESTSKPTLAVAEIVALSICVVVCVVAFMFFFYTFFIRKSRSVATTTALYAASALVLVLGYPRVHPQTTEHGLVVNSRSFWNRGVMHTVATVQTTHGLERVERLGGQIGNYRQEVLDAPSGDQLIPGTRVPLHN